MSTTDKKHGFVPVKSLVGGAIRTREYHVDSANATGVFIGDLVMIENDGNIAPATADIGLACIGVATGVKDVNRVAIKAGYLAASTEGYVDVVDDPYVVFRVQEDGAGTSLIEAQTAIGNTANHVAGAGSTTTGISAHTINSDDVGTGAQLKIVGLYEDPNNAFTDTYTEVLVLINEHHYKAAVVGV
ncbi:hypothetical protein EPN95_04525 [Patescibacteria group bacterium]|nr:MAG: hypothetical protein EPN95_04525 [Patescibacteria group bacterium]